MCYEIWVNDIKKVYQENKEKMWLAWALTGPLMIVMFLHMVMDIMVVPLVFYKIFEIIVGLLVVFGIGRKTFLDAYKSLKNKNANMDLLIALGTIMAVLTGPLSFGTQIVSYAWIGAMIMAFHLTGRYIEAKAKWRASQAIEKLLDMQAQTGRRLQDWETQMVDINDIKVGDILVVKPWEKIPTDGVVVKWNTKVDESMATWESMPVPKETWDEVIWSSINQNWLIHIETTKVGENTFLSQVVEMVKQAQWTKVPIQAFADKVTSVFVPTVVVLAIITFLVWILVPDVMVSIRGIFESYIPWIDSSLTWVTGALYAMIAVLVIACPCALWLATPTALMVGTGLGAQNGVLIKDWKAIQTLKEVDTVVFDKTWTITQWEPKVTNFEIDEKYNEKNILQKIWTLESWSEHPLAGAILEYVQEKGIETKEVSEFESITWKWVKWVVQGDRVFIGNEKILEDQQIDYSRFEQKINELKNQWKTVMSIVLNDSMVWIIAVADKIKKDSQKAIEKLKEMWYNTAIITWDNNLTAKAIASQVWIDHVVSEVLPDGKVKEIKKLQNKFGKIAMIGDGINDAPALTQADVGIGIWTWTDIAIESSDITLVDGSLMGVIKAINLSKMTFAKIKQNLFWAFVYNIFAIPMAMIGILHPIIAEIAMAMSSISVVTNANLLKNKDITPEL